jgi:lysozyme
MLTALIIFIKEIEEAYGKAPILYITYESYKKYLKGQTGKYRIWIRDVFSKPDMPDNIEWTFWQYADHGRVKGVKGPVDLNVFCKKDLSNLKNL